MTPPRPGGNYVVDTSVIEGMYFAPLSSNFRGFACFPTLEASSPEPRRHTASLTLRK